MSGYLVDTDCTIDVLNNRPEMRRTIDALDGPVSISIVSCAELYEGVSALTLDDQRRLDLDSFIEGTSVLGVDDETARVFGRIRLMLRRSGQLIGDMDLLIAATAIRWDMTLVTRDKHFDRINELRRQAPI